MFVGINLELYQNWRVLVRHTFEELLPLLTAFYTFHFKLYFLLELTRNEGQIFVRAPRVACAL